MPTALEVRQAVVTVATTETLSGTQDNPVSVVYFWEPDQIAFGSTPALVACAPDDDEHPLTLGARTLGGGSSNGVTQTIIRTELEYLDAPIAGDDLQEQMAAVETWFEQAKANLRANRLGQINGQATWLSIERMRTQIDRPLRDSGRVMYHGTLNVWTKVILSPP